MISSVLRLLALFFGAVLLTAATPVRDWTTVTRLLPNGAHVTGNPAAPLKLVEYGSYTCSHCADFAVESRAVLHDRMIRSGKVSLEYRHLIRDRLDLGAAVLARCAGPARFDGASHAIFTAQETWIKRVVDWQAAHPEATQQPPLDQLRALVAAAGFDTMMKARGLSQARIDACLANKAEIDRIVKMTADAPPEVQSTPFFFLNGAAQPPLKWATLEPILRAKGAR
jgi:protein-disulfide isomerase